MYDIVRITGFNIPELEIYSGLNEPQLLHCFEPDLGLFIAESPNVIERALDGGYEPLSVLVTDAVLDAVTEILDRHAGGYCGASDIFGKGRKNVKIYVGSEAVLCGIAGYKLTKGALCAMRRRPLETAEEVLGKIGADTGRKRIAVLEEIVNPVNIGAIFRSAAALNVDAVLLTAGCCDPLYRRAIRVSMGTVFQVPWTFLTENNYIEFLKKEGFATAAMALRQDSCSISAPELKSEDKLAIVLGTEGDGLADRTIGDCDYTVMIPMSHGVDSLNVAAASAVAFWELCGK